MASNSNQERLAKIFCPEVHDRFVKARTVGTRFVHYTNAVAAMNIIRTREVWMRKSLAMNDFTEVRHGLECVDNSLNKGDSGKILREGLNQIQDGTWEKVDKLFQGWRNDFEFHTYVFSISEHDSFEDRIGRLSMWRAYGESAGVAFVVNGQPFVTISDALKAYTSPILYQNDTDFESSLDRVGQNIIEDRDFLKTLDCDQVVSYAFNTLRSAALFTKHPGFKEEKEWRVMYAPNFEHSSHLEKTVQVVRGIPQPIYKLPLKDLPDEGLSGIEIPALIDRIIIGPVDSPFMIFEAFCDLLRDAGVPEPEKKIVISNIPLR
jgi:hypothetical protein